ncbi:MAG: lantibiotic dehydratase, partial [Saprospiraceae bacterium]
MKLFPHILARVGGATFSKVEAMSFSKMSYVNVLLKKEKDLEFQFEKVLQCFRTTFEKTQDYRLKAILKNAKKDFQNHRFSFVKKLEKNNQDEFLKKLLFEISNYLNSKFSIEKLNQEFEFIFRKEEIIQYLKLINFFQNQNIQRGILQSSHSLFNQIKKLDSNAFLDFRKKERQSLRTLAQYFYRIGTKTSPFSHFTTLDLLSAKNGVFQNEDLKKENSFFQFNNFILAEMKNILLKETSFFRQLKLQVNPSLSIKNDEFYFIKNSRNVETIQQIEVAEILKELTKNIIPNEGLNFESTVAKLLELVEADQESIENYLLELIEIGFLEWQWEFSGLTFGWEEKFQKLLFSMENKMNLMNWSAVLGNIIDGRLELELSKNTSPYILQKSLKTDLEELGVKNVIPELIFFKDVKKLTSIQLPKKEVALIIQSLDSLLRLLEPLTENEMTNRIVNCWNQNFSKEKSIPLIYFYEMFFKKSLDKTSINTFGKIKKDNFLQKVKLEIKEKVKIDQNGNLHFYIKDLKNIFSERSKTTS